VADSGDDEVYGGAGGEAFIFGREGSDLLVGRSGADNIFISEFPNTNPGVDTVKGGGNEGIDAVDGRKDFVDCGRGLDDYVEFDRRKDEVETNCETRVPKP
jgi:hypothetical protein